MSSLLRRGFLFSKNIAISQNICYNIIKDNPKAVLTENLTKIKMRSDFKRQNKKKKGSFTIQYIKASFFRTKGMLIFYQKGGGCYEKAH